MLNYGPAFVQKRSCKSGAADNSDNSDNADNSDNLDNSDNSDNADNSDNSLIVTNSHQLLPMATNKHQ